MEEKKNLQKDGVLLAPVTPTKLGCRTINNSQIPQQKTVETSANLSAEEAVSNHKHAGVTETEARNVFGTEVLDYTSDLSQSQKQQQQHGTKRKKTGIDLNKKPRQRMKMKKHRPKILDVSKPKKIPKAKKERENVCKSRNTMIPESEHLAPNPCTPELLPPKLVTVDRNFERSSRRHLNFDVEDHVKEGSSGNIVLDMSAGAEHRDGNAADFKSCKNEHDDGLLNHMLNVENARRIINAYQPRRCQKAGDKSIFNLLLLSLPSESQDFGASTGMRKIIEEYQGQTTFVQQWDIKALELLEFPKAFKQRRSGRQRRTMYAKLENTDKLSSKATTNRRLGVRSNNKSRIPLPFFLLVEKKKRSKIYTRQACEKTPTADNDTLLGAVGNSLADSDTLLGAGGNSLGEETHPSCEKTPTADNDTLFGAARNSLGEEALPSMGKDEGEETHPSLGKDKDSIQAGFQVYSFVENQSTAVYHDQIQNINLNSDNGLLEMKLGLPPYENENVTNSTIQEHLEQKNVPSNTKDDIPDIEDLFNGSNDPLKKDMLDLIQKLECLHIRDESWQLIVRDQNAAGALIPHKGRIGRKPKKPTPKVDLDQETMRVWNLLMENGGGEDKTNDNEDKEKYWEEQRELFEKRVDSFIARMHLIQGNRRFSRWKGSVVDSIVGVFLTQNVSDHLSSSAYMSLASRFPPKSKSNNLQDENESTPLSQESVGSNGEAKGLTNDVDSMQSHVSQTELHSHQELAGKGEESIVSIEDPALDSAALDSAVDGRAQEFLSCQKDSMKATSSSQRTGEEEATSRIQGGITGNCSTSLSNCQGSISCNVEENAVTEDNVTSNKKDQGRRKGKQAKKKDNVSTKRKGKVGEKKENPVDWDELRRTYSSGKRNHGSTMDSIDWEKVRLASDEEISSIIAQRGMHNVIGKRIKNFLDRMVKDHGSTDLEWLRDVPPDKTKEYLLSIDGLGLKSVECVRLLTLHHHAFPVDTNVGRVAVRLGWVPLQPLPEDIEIDLLNNYPLVDSIQKYLWPRLCKLPQHILYELHYQMITFGKVFCTKKQPNCNACPLKAECRHFASAFARAKLRLPGPQEQNTTRTNAPYLVDYDASKHATQSTEPLLKASCSESIYGSQSCEPIIEIPVYGSQSCEPIIEIPASPEPSPEPQCSETLERDIEDLCDDFDGEIPTIKLNTKEFRENLLKYMEEKNRLHPGGDISKALVAVTPEAASIPAPRLKTVEHLRTVHHVYELPDSHPILAGFEKREPDDPCSYLFAVWPSDDASEDQNDETVSGTILIPCRTANRGSFPLNGTYFQVNEVFSDHDFSKNPIKVPREWLWNLPRRDLYCGSSATSIFKDMTLPEIQYCFWKAFVCVRGIDKRGAPRTLHKRFHRSGDKEVE